MSKGRRRRNKARREDKPAERFGDSAFTKILLVVIVVAMLITLGVLWQRSTQPLDTSDYEGRIVDRWANYAETDQGSLPRFFLVVDDAQSRRFTVRVDPTTYESAKVGMRIKRESGKIVLIDPVKTPR